ncbi:hypothetical protein HC256_009840 [Beauveria bassiana]|uniref:Integral membrane protein, putative n=1 Tax=Beauveria bassiana (strain ARSEF 2860) TaxID=655819 RepID=J5JB40_BEAB2|nr:integral membrane protein, putative [Beauveria bassiana ARSEF 2860]EJP61201.1 integral membrane protein, putative [Beauveria bassiana ARSEF 2860]KAH8709936.1 hypothetical protein HC256_009840 [Beauveria bassiana]
MAAAVSLLRIAPLLSTSAYLTFTAAEDLYFKPYLDPSVAKAAEALLPAYIAIWYSRGMVLIFTIYPLTWCTAIANLPVDKLVQQSKPAFILYILGLAFSLGHMLWGPRAMSLLNSIKEKKGQGSTDIVRVWCRMNLTRGLLVDVPAWGCFLAAFLIWTSSR